MWNHCEVTTRTDDKLAMIIFPPFHARLSFQLVPTQVALIGPHHLHDGGVALPPLISTHPPRTPLQMTWIRRSVCLVIKRCVFSHSAGGLYHPPHPPPRLRLLLYLPLFFYRQTCHDVWYEEFASEALFNNQPVFVLSPGSLLGFTEGHLELDFLKSHALKFSDAKNLSFNFQSGR